MDFDLLKNFMDSLTSSIIPGNSVVVYHKNEEVFRYSSGFSDVEKQIKMTGNELLNIYSCSKVATVVAALQLYEKGLFLLDDPLYEYISEFKEMYIKDSDGIIKKANNPITLRHLFTHTAGFTYNFDKKHVETLMDDKKDMSTISVAKAMTKDTLIFEPGTSWSYSFAHDVLGAVIEVVSGVRLSEYVKENIFSPLGVYDVFYHRTPEIYSKMAQQYRYDVPSDTGDIVKLQADSVKDGGKVINVGKEMMYEFSDAYDSGGAGIVTSVDSYAKFANALAMGDNRILSKGTIELLRTNQLDDRQINNFNWPQLNGYGYGLGVRTMIDRAKSGSNGAIGEFGWGGAAGANVLVDPDNEFSCFYAHHMLNPLENYYQPRLRNVLYSCLKQ